MPSAIGDVSLIIINVSFKYAIKANVECCQRWGQLIERGPTSETLVN